MEKTIKVDGPVHQRLEELKAKHNADTFNNVLELELGIVPQTPRDLLAFLPDDLIEFGIAAIKLIRSIDDFEETYEANGQNSLQFRSADTGRVVAALKANENGFTVEYRNQRDTLAQCGRGYERQNGTVVYGTYGDVYDETTTEEVLDSIEKKVSRSTRRWG